MYKDFRILQKYNHSVITYEDISRLLLFGKKIKINSIKVLQYLIVKIPFLRMVDSTSYVF